LQPIDSSRMHDLGQLVIWHARLMVLAWCFCALVAVVITRYFKVLPNQDWPKQLDNKFWWNSHLSLQFTNILLSIIAFVLIIVHQGTGWDLHRFLGWVVLSLMFVQAISGLFRGSKGGPTDLQMRGDHYDMTIYRYIFEYYHKIMGYTVLVLANITIFSGLWQANAPRWMFITIGVWLIVLLSLVIFLQRSKGCIDTYQAIWGKDKIHPGNKKPYVGWGIFRK